MVRNCREVFNLTVNVVKNVGPTRASALGGNMSAPYGKGSWHQILRGSICSLLINSHRNSHQVRESHVTCTWQDTIKNQTQLTGLSTRSSSKYDIIFYNSKTTQDSSAATVEQTILQCCDLKIPDLVISTLWSCDLENLVVTSKPWS